MGIFDKLKNAANFVTGGGASVELAIPDGNLGSPLIATVHIKTKKDNLEVKNVYLNIRCSETTKEEISTEDGPEIKENEEVLYDNKLIIAEGSTFEGGKEYSFSKEIVLPQDSKATMSENNVDIIWEFQAGLDVKGNDPDSGWIKVNLTNPQ